MTEAGAVVRCPGGAWLHMRRPLAADRERLASIVRATASLTDEEKDCAVELLDIYLGEPRQTDYQFIAAADESDRPAGYVCYGNRPLADGVIDLYWIVVDPASTGKGVGSALLCHAASVASGEGARMMVAETSGKPSYAQARSFYLKNGFVEEARVVDFYRPDDDLVVYVKRF